MEEFYVIVAYVKYNQKKIIVTPSLKAFKHRVKTFKFAEVKQPFAGNPALEEKPIVSVNLLREPFETVKVSILCGKSVILYDPSNGHHTMYHHTIKGNQNHVCFKNKVLIIKENNKMFGIMDMKLLKTTKVFLNEEPKTIHSSCHSNIGRGFKMCKSNMFYLTKKNHLLTRYIESLKDSPYTGENWKKEELTLEKDVEDFDIKGGELATISPEGTATLHLILFTRNEVTGLKLIGSHRIDQEEVETYTSFTAVALGLTEFVASGFEKFRSNIRLFLMNKKTLQVTSTLSILSQEECDPEPDEDHKLRPTHQLQVKLIRKVEFVFALGTFRELHVAAIFKGELYPVIKSFHISDNDCYFISLQILNKTLYIGGPRQLFMIKFVC